MSVKRRAFSPEFKREAASLVLDQDYSYPQACESLGVGETALRRWTKQLVSELSGFGNTIMNVHTQRLEAYRLDNY